MVFVERVKKEMARQGVNTRQLAIRCGKPSPTILKILSGENDCSLSIAVLIAEALNIPIADLLKN